MRLRMTIWAMLILTGASICAAPKSADELLTTFKKAVAAKDTSQVITLYCLDGSPETITKTLPLQLASLTNNVIQSIDMHDMSKEEKSRLETGFPYQGKRLVASIPVSKEISVKFTTSDANSHALAGMRLPVGEKSGEWFIVGSRLID